MSSSRHSGEPPVGVVLANVGTPDDPSVPAVRRYLREFLGDRNVVDANRVLWWLVLRLVILPFRSPRSAELYRRVWTPEGSPLLVYSEKQRDAVQAELGSGFAVRLGMAVGNPSLPSALSELADLGCERVFLLPLFPQNSGTTVGAVKAAAERWMRAAGEPFSLQTVSHFASDPDYLDVLAEHIRPHWESGRYDHFVFSYHGIPLRYVERGDRYPDDCEATTAGVRERLGLDESSSSMVFQSRFGRSAWLEPYASEAVPKLAERFPRVLIACPGFVSDCLETIDEIGRELAAEFREAGGEELKLVPALNDSPAWCKYVAQLLRRTSA